MNYSYTLITHYSFKNFLIVNGCATYKCTHRGYVRIQNFESPVYGISTLFLAFYVRSMYKFSANGYLLYHRNIVVFVLLLII